MPVDVSMYPGPPQQVNPLQAMTQAAGLQGQLQQNQIRARTMAAQQAIGQAYQQSTDASGHVDADAASLAISQDPNAAYGAEAATANLQAQRQAQLVQHVGEVELGIRQQGFMTQQLGSLSDTKNISGKDVANLAASFVQQGILTPKMAASELAQAPTDPAQLPLYLQGLQKRSMDAGQQLGLYHQKLMTNIGGSIVPMNSAPLGDQGPVATTMSPEGASTPTQIMGKDGVPEAVTRSQFVGMAQDGPVQVGQSQAQAAAGQVTGASNAKRAQDLSIAASTANDTKALLGNMKGDLNSFIGGKGAGQWKDFLSGINRIFPGSIDPNGVASQENFNKAQTLLAQRSFSSLGGTGTDAKLDSAIHSNPNEAVSQLGNEGIIALNKGFADALALKNNLWQKALQKGQTADSYGQFENSFNQKYDPRVFQFQYLDKKGQDQVVSGMTSAEKGQFFGKLHYAEQKHWVGGQ